MFPKVNAVIIINYFYFEQKTNIVLRNGPQEKAKRQSRHSF